MIEQMFGRERAILAPARGDVAQLGEHRVRIAGVRGSSPLISTIRQTPFSLAGYPSHAVSVSEPAPELGSRSVTSVRSYGWLLSRWMKLAVREQR